jgi:GT2 family glycosyltransferase
MLEVVIPFFKNKIQLAKCKEHIKASGVSTQLYIHDNSDKNIGFTRGVNEGLKQSLETPHPYVMVINQDLYLEPEAIPEMIKFMDANPSFGLVAPLQVEGDEVVCGGGAQMLPVGYNFCGPLENYKEPYSVTWCEAACWFIRKEMMREIGLLDKNMVMFFSDSDYCLRARMANWVVGMVPAAKCCHERGCTKKENANKKMDQQKQHDATYFHAKWLSGDLHRLLDHKKNQPPRQILGKNIVGGEDV